LAEPEFGVGLGAVAGHYLGGGPRVAVGDQNAFAEDFVGQFRAGAGIDMPVQAMFGWGVTGHPS
jgi:hypothetical protein